MNITLIIITGIIILAKTMMIKKKSKRISNSYCDNKANTIMMIMIITNNSNVNINDNNSSKNDNKSVISSFVSYGRHT